MAAIDRVHSDAKRALEVLDGRLAVTKYLAGHEYSIADIANLGWIWRREFAGVGFAETPHDARWHEDIQGRQTVKKAMARVAGRAAGPTKTRRARDSIR